MKKYLIKYSNKVGQDAGFKAREDICNILSNNNFNIVNIKIGENKLDRILHILLLKKYLKDIKENSFVVIEWPIINSTCTNRMIKILKSKNCKIVTLIHDIKSLRFRLDNLISEDIDSLNKFDLVISHNSKMSKWMIDNGLKTKYINLKIFDYITPKVELSPEEFIVFAGNLNEEKSGFIYNMGDIKNIKINLYGPNVVKEKLNENIIYRGSYQPEELLENLTGKYGLIWDGSSVNTCSGALGEYIKYNNPHKVSLYIAAGLPVIIWREAALAKFVIENNIGIIIDSVEDIADVVNKVENYNDLKNNVKIIRDRIINGRYTLETIDKAYRILGEDNNEYS